MRKRAVLTFTILLGALWAAGVSPAAGQVPPGPPPDVELPKDKKPKPDKPGKPDPPEEPSEPAPPSEPEPEPPPEEPAPPASEEPAIGGGGGTGGGGSGSGGATTGGSGADPRAADGGAAPAGAVLEATASAGEPGRWGEGGPSTRMSRSVASPAGGPEEPGVLRGVAGSSVTEARPERSTPAAVAEEVVASVGVLPLALLGAGVALLAIGVSAGVAQARVVRPER